MLHSKDKVRKLLPQKKVRFFYQPICIFILLGFYFWFSNPLMGKSLLFVTCCLGAHLSITFFKIGLEPSTLVHISNLLYHLCTWHLLERVNFMKNSMHPTLKLSSLVRWQFVECFCMMKDLIHLSSIKTSRYSSKPLMATC